MVAMNCVHHVHEIHLRIRMRNSNAPLELEAANVINFSIRWFLTSSWQCSFFRLEAEYGPRSAINGTGMHILITATIVLPASSTPTIIIIISHSYNLESGPRGPTQL